MRISRIESGGRASVSQVCAKSARASSSQSDAHITGGGLRNIQRVLPEGLTYQIDRTAIPCPPVIRLIAQAGDIPENEVFTVWNIGLGYVFVVSPHAAQTLLSTLQGSFVCGEIVRAL